jgi:hypothetical protein
MKPVLPCAVMTMVVLFGVPGYAAERLVPYDDFNAAYINPDRWFGGEYSPSFPGGSTEAVRQLQDNRLRLLYRSYGFKHSDSGGIRSELVLMFRNAAFITAIQATVQVTDAVTTGCPGNPDNALARAMLGGRFFGGPASTPDGDVRDMVASIGIAHVSGATDPPDVFQAQSLVFYCANRPCTAGTYLHRQDLGAVKRGEMVKLRVQWDRIHGQFIFQRDEQPEVFARYAVPADIVAPGIPVKLLHAIHFVPHCTATPRPMAYIDAWFDDVMVNESAAPAGER